MEHAARRVTIGIDLDPGSTPVSGTLRPATGRPIAFTGWIELVATLHEQIAQADQAGWSMEEGKPA